MSPEEAIQAIREAMQDFLEGDSCELSTLDAINSVMEAYDQSEVAEARQ